jgi:hypothetical protein
MAKLVYSSSSLVLILLSAVQLLIAQDTSTTSKSFELTLVTYNHAERIFAGTTEYIITSNRIRVKNFGFGEQKGKAVFSKRLTPTKQSIIELSNLKLDTLDDNYTNWCVMLTSGTEYMISFERGGSTKNINLHHYYLKPIADLIALINENLPKKLQVGYVSKDTKQGCKLEDFLNSSSAQGSSKEGSSPRHSQ